MSNKCLILRILVRKFVLQRIWNLQCERIQALVFITQTNSEYKINYNTIYKVPWAYDNEVIDTYYLSLSTFSLLLVAQIYRKQILSKWS